METARIRSTDLSHICDEQRSKCASEAPGREHKAVDRPDILRSKVVGGKSRHGAEAAPVTHQDDERQDGKNRRRRSSWKHPKEADLKKEHRHEGPPPGDCVGDPGPKDPAHGVANAGNADHSRGYDS